MGVGDVELLVRPKNTRTTAELRRFQLFQLFAKSKQEQYQVSGVVNMIEARGGVLVSYTRKNVKRPKEKVRSLTFGTMSFM